MVTDFVERQETRLVYREDREKTMLAVSQKVALMDTDQTNCICLHTHFFYDQKISTYVKAV